MRITKGLQHRLQRWAWGRAKNDYYRYLSELRAEVIALPDDDFPVWLAKRVAEESESQKKKTPTP